MLLPPAPVSPFTGRPEWDWITASGRGTLWSFVVFHQSYFAGMKDELPYPVVMVKLDEGPFLLTNLDGLEPEDLADRHARSPSASPAGRRASSCRNSARRPAA